MARLGLRQRSDRKESTHGLESGTLSLPGVDVGANLAGALPPRLGVLVEQHLDPAPCIGRVDDVVDLPVLRHRYSLAALVRGGDHCVERALALAGIADRLELATHPQAHRAFETHAAELRRRPANR